MSYDHSKNIYLNCDCMDLMKQYPDKYFDLAIVDPPYGIFNKNVSGFMKKRMGANEVKWDNVPEKQYFDELKRVSKNQIIWGGNYFFDKLGNTKEPIIWNKLNGTNFFGDGELAWSSFKGSLRIFNHQWCGAFKDSERGQKSKHPTQKPIELYLWLIKNYAKEGDLILDTHVGSASSLIAFEELQFNYVACELDKDYYEQSKKRLEKYRSQMSLF